MGMRKLISSFPHFLMFLQNPVHGPHGAQVIAFIQKGVIDLLGRLIDKAICMENIQNSLFLFTGQGQGWNRPLTFLSVIFLRILPAVKTGPGNRQSITGLLDIHIFGQRFGYLHEFFSSFGSGDIWKISAIFF